MMDLEQLADLDADGVLAAAEAAQGQMVAAECRRFVLAAHWVDLHPGEALDEQRRRSGVRVLPGMERSRRSGADGTPLVAEFAAAELGAVLGMGPVAAGCFVRDAVNVRFRHPRLWAGVLAGRVRVWQAREVARTCAAAGLDVARTGWVDEVTTPYLASLPWARFEAFLQAKVIEADPAAAEQRARAAALARFVRTGQSSEYGLRTIVARAEAGDVVFFTAMVDRVAAVLAEEGDTDPVDVRRSKAIGILASPAGALLLLQRSAERDTQDADAQAGHGEAESETCPSCDGTGVASGDATPFLRPPVDLSKVDPKRLLPQATLYVHLSQAALDGVGGGVARVENLGPVTVDQVAAFLGHRNVRVVPVIDVAGQAPVDGYEVPDRMREALHLRQPGVCVPLGHPRVSAQGRRARRALPTAEPRRAAGADEHGQPGVGQPVPAPVEDPRPVAAATTGARGVPVALTSRLVVAGRPPRQPPPRPRDHHRRPTPQHSVSPLEHRLAELIERHRA